MRVSRQFPPERHQANARDTGRGLRHKPRHDDFHETQAAAGSNSAACTLVPLPRFMGSYHHFCRSLVVALERGRAWGQSRISSPRILVSGP